MDGLLSFPFCGKKVILNKLGRIARSYQLYAVTVFAVLEGSIGKNCFKIEWVLPLNYMGPNQGPYRPWYFAIHCQVLSQSIPSFSFTYDMHILPMHSFLIPFILRLLYFIHFGSTASDREMLTSLLSPTFLSNTSTISHIPTQVVLFSPHAALTTDQASSSLLSG